MLDRSGSCRYGPEILICVGHVVGTGWRVMHALSYHAADACQLLGRDAGPSDVLLVRHLRVHIA